MTKEQRLKILAELNNAETLLEMKTSLIQLNESIKYLRKDITETLSINRLDNTLTETTATRFLNG
jgi:hypothetical protein